MFSEEPHGAKLVWVHLIHEWVCVLAEGSCENDKFVVLRHHSQEVVHTWSLFNKDVTHVSININWNNIIWASDLVELTVDESFI